MLTATRTTYEHIRLDERGVPIIAGTTMKVVELVMAHMAHGWSPEELHFSFHTCPSARFTMSLTN
jgi:uncharacterized protein (DUF433 family)